MSETSVAMTKTTTVDATGTLATAVANLATAINLGIVPLASVWTPNTTLVAASAERPSGRLTADATMTTTTAAAAGTVSGHSDHHNESQQRFVLTMSI